MIIKKANDNNKKIDNDIKMSVYHYYYKKIFSKYS
jgi:hypothetical protein